MNHCHLNKQKQKLFLPIGVFQSCPSLQCYMEQASLIFIVYSLLNLSACLLDSKCHKGKIIPDVLFLLIPIQSLQLSCTGIICSFVIHSPYVEKRRNDDDLEYTSRMLEYQKKTMSHLNPLTEVGATHFHIHLADVQLYSFVF